MSYWFYLFFILPACCVFAAGINTSAKIRYIRLPIALVLTYVGLILDVKIRTHANDDGLALGFTILLGWAPSIMYVGLLECIWRSIHRNKIDDMENLNTNRISKGFAITGGVLFAACLLYFAGGLMSALYE